MFTSTELYDYKYTIDAVPYFTKYQELSVYTGFVSVDIFYVFFFRAGSGGSRHTLRELSKRVWENPTIISQFNNFFYLKTRIFG